MAHIKNRLRGLLVAFVALVAALAIVPGVATASPWIVEGNPTARTITITGLKGGETLNVYQIAVVEYDSTSNTTELVNVPVDEQNKDFGVTETKTYIDDASGSRANADALIATMADHVQAIATGTAGQDGTCNFNSHEFEAGLYYVQITNEDSSYTYSPMIVSLSPDADSGTWNLDNVSVPAKVAESDVHKYFVDENGDKQEMLYADLDKTYNFEIDFSIPVKQDKFVVTDTMDGFVLSDDVTVKVGSDTLESGVDYVLTVNQGNDGFTIEFTSTYLESLEATAEVVVTYSATIDSSAPVSGATNSVKTTNDSEGDEVTAEFGKVGVYKYTQDNGEKPLPGVQFKLYTDADCKNAVQVDGQDVVLTSQDDGYAWTNAEGEITAEPKLEVDTTYYLQEFRTVDGYVKVDTAFPVVASDKDADAVAYNVETQTGNYAKVLNEPAGPGEGVDLPETGGMGTVALTAAGVVLVAGAAAFIVRSRKEN